VLAWSRWRFVCFASDEKPTTTLALLAECFESIGAVPKIVLADRRLSMRFWSVAGSTSSGISIAAPANRSGATSTHTRDRLSTLTLRSWATSPTAAAGGSSAGRKAPRTALSRPARPTASTATRSSATRSSTAFWTTAAESSTQRSTTARPPPPPSLYCAGQCLVPGPRRPDRTGPERQRQLLPQLSMV
jgi:hypothetical protein